MDKLELFKKIDKFIGTPLCFSLGIFNKLTKKQPLEPKRILLIKLVAVGDLVVALPTIKALRLKFPDAWIAILVTPRVREVVEGCPFLDEIIYYDIFGNHKGIRGLMVFIKELRKKRVDTVIEMDHYYRISSLITYCLFPQNWIGFDLHGQGRRGLFSIRVPYRTDIHEVEAFLELAKALGGDNTTPKLVELWTSEDDKTDIDLFFEQNGILSDDFVVGIHPGTGPSATCRRWSPERFAGLANWLIREYKAKVIFTGAPSEIELVGNIIVFMQEKPIVAAGKTSLKQLAEIARRCRLFISVDTGPLHVAAAMGTRVIGLYGPNIPYKWGPYGKGHITIYKQLSCSPCTKQYLGQVSRCQNPICMEQITLEDVKMVVKEMIKGM